MEGLELNLVDATESEKGDGVGREQPAAGVEAFDIDPQAITVSLPHYFCL